MTHNLHGQTHLYRSYTMRRNLTMTAVAIEILDIQECIRGEGTPLSAQRACLWKSTSLFLQLHHGILLTFSISRSSSTTAHAQGWYAEIGISECSTHQRQVRAWSPV